MRFRKRPLLPDNVIQPAPFDKLHREVRRSVMNSRVEHLSDVCMLAQLRRRPPFFLETLKNFWSNQARVEEFDRTLPLQPFMPSAKHHARRTNTQLFADFIGA